MRMPPKMLLLILVAVCSTTAASAQESTGQFPLSLADALALADSNSYAVLQAGAERMIANAEAHSARAAYLPRLSLTNTATTTTDPLNVFGFRLKQSSVTQQDFNPALLNDPDRFEHFSTRVDVYQPLVNLSGLMERRAALHGEEAASLGEFRTRQAVAFQVKQVYFGLVASKQRLEILKESLRMARSSRKQAGSFFDEGLITRAELLQADVHVLDLETQLNSAAFAVENSSDNLRFLLGLPEAVSIIPTDSLSPVATEMDSVTGQNRIGERSDIRALASAVAAGTEQVSASRYRFLPSVDLFGSYEWNGSGFLGSDGRNWGIGAVLKWNLFAGYAQAGGVERSRARLRKAELAYDEQLSRSRLEVAEARRAMVEAAQRLELSESSVRQASESLRIRTDRYTAGLERTTDVLSAELSLANQRLAKLQGLYDFYVSIFRLEFLLEETLLAL